MNTLWPASLADQAMESPHGIHAFRTPICENPALHFHQSNEFIFLVAGLARQRVGDRCTPLRPGDLHFPPARSWHIADAEKEAPAIVLNFYDTSFSRSIPADREALAIVRHLAERARTVDSAIPLTEAAREGRLPAGGVGRGVRDPSAGLAERGQDTTPRPAPSAAAQDARGGCVAREQRTVLQ